MRSALVAGLIGSIIGCRSNDNKFNTTKCPMLRFHKPLYYFLCLRYTSLNGNRNIDIQYFCLKDTITLFSLLLFYK